MKTSEAIAHAAETQHQPIEILRGLVVIYHCQDCLIEEMARDLCDTYYLSVDLNNTMSDAFSKITEKTRQHWRTQAVLMLQRAWTR